MSFGLSFGGFSTQRGFTGRELPTTFVRECIRLLREDKLERNSKTFSKKKLMDFFDRQDTVTFTAKSHKETTYDYVISNFYVECLGVADSEGYDAAEMKRLYAVDDTLLGLVGKWSDGIIDLSELDHEEMLERLMAEVQGSKKFVPHKFELEFSLWAWNANIFGEDFLPETRRVLIALFKEADDVSFATYAGALDDVRASYIGFHWATPKKVEGNSEEDPWNLHDARVKAQYFVALDPLRNPNTEDKGTPLDISRSRALRAAADERSGIAAQKARLEDEEAVDAAARTLHGLRHAKVESESIEDLALATAEADDEAPKPRRGPGAGYKLDPLYPTNTGRKEGYAWAKEHIASGPRTKHSVAKLKEACKRANADAASDGLRWTNPGVDEDVACERLHKFIVGQFDSDKKKERAAALAAAPGAILV